MAKLTDEETALMKRLKDKLDAPEAAPVGKTVNFNLDLSNPEHMALAKREGWLQPDEQPNGDGGDGDEGDETPKRKGYFAD